MPSVQLPNVGLNYDWDDGESGIKVQMDENWATVDNLLQIGVISRVVATPPGSPVDGDRYIIATSATGDWVGQDGNLARWNEHTSLWEIYAPRVGWLAFVEAEDVLTVYKSTGWASGLAI